MDACRRVLLVDSDLQLVESISRGLRERGFECHGAQGLAQARRRFDSASFGVVIADLDRREGDSLHFVETLCEGDEAPSVILLAARPTLESALRAVDLHFSAYLRKPVEMPVLLRRVEMAMEQSLARQRLGWVRQQIASAREELQGFDELLRGIDPALAGASTPQLTELAFAVESLIASRGNGGREQRIEAIPPARRHWRALAMPPVGGVLPVDGRVQREQSGWNEVKLLTARERQVLDELLTGFRVSTIARRLFISPHTVRNHLKSIFSKLQVRSQAELVETLKPL